MPDDTAMFATFARGGCESHVTVCGSASKFHVTVAADPARTTDRSWGVNAAETVAVTDPVSAGATTAMLASPVSVTPL